MDGARANCFLHEQLVLNHRPLSPPMLLLCAAAHWAQVVSLGAERFQAAELLFQPALAGQSARGVHALAYDCITACAIDLRREFYGNVILSGVHESDDAGQQRGHATGRAAAAPGGMVRCGAAPGLGSWLHAAPEGSQDLPAGPTPLSTQIETVLRPSPRCRRRQHVPGAAAAAGTGAGCRGELQPG